VFGPGIGDIEKNLESQISNLKKLFPSDPSRGFSLFSAKIVRITGAE